MGMLRYSKQYLPIKAVQTKYKSLVEPYFRYRCPGGGGGMRNHDTRQQSVRMPSAARTMSAGNFVFRLTHRKFIICNLHIFTFAVITLESFEDCVLIAVA